VDCVLQEGETAVHLAAELTPTDVHYELEDSDIIRLLLEFGGDVNIPTTLVLFPLSDDVANHGIQHLHLCHTRISSKIANKCAYSNRPKYIIKLFHHLILSYQGKLAYRCRSYRENFSSLLFEIRGICEYVHRQSRRPL